MKLGIPADCGKTVATLTPPPPQSSGHADDCLSQLQWLEDFNQGAVVEGIEIIYDTITYMQKHLLTLILLLHGTLMGHAQYSVLNGDLNHDGKITVEDVTMMTNIVLEKSPAQTINSAAELSYSEVPVLAESAELLSGYSFNSAIKQLVNPSADYYTGDSPIKKITFRKGSSAEGTIVSSASSLGEARAVYNAETQEVDIYVATNKLVFPEDCSGMFYLFISVTQIDWSAFGPNIDTSNVTDMSYIFYGCEVITTLDLSNFDTSNVTDMRRMFGNCFALTTLDLSNFNTSNVTDMNHMFTYCNALTTLDFSNFDTGKVTNISHMFYNCIALTTIDLSNFNTDKVTNMRHMFCNCQALTTLDLSNFDTSNVTDISYMFSNCQALTTIDLSNFDTHKVTNMCYMFIGCTKLTALNLGRNFTIIDGCYTDWMLKDTPNDTDTPYCTITCTEATQAKLLGTSTRIDKDKIRWNIIEGVVPELAESAELLSGEDFNVAIKQLVDPSASHYEYDKTIKKITFRKGCTDEGTIVSSASSLGDARAVFNAETQEVDIYVAANKLVFPENCRDMFYCFCYVSQIDWSAFGTDIDTSNVTDMRFMFFGCEALTSLDLSNFDTSKVTNMSDMFEACRALTTLDLSHFDTSNVTDMNEMFVACNALTTLDVTHFDTSNVTNMNSMFDGCIAINMLDVSHFDTSNVTNMGWMFCDCYCLSSLKLGSNYIISDECNISNMLRYTPNDTDTPYCTITCTTATKDKLLDSSTSIDKDKILWDIF